MDSYCDEGCNNGMVRGAFKMKISPLGGLMNREACKFKRNRRDCTTGGSVVGGGEFLSK